MLKGIKILVFCRVLLLSLPLFSQYDEKWYMPDSNLCNNELVYTAYDSAIKMNLTDGPYIWWNKKNNQLRIVYYSHSAATRRTKRMISRLKLPLDDTLAYFKGINGDTNIYLLFKNNYPQPSEYSGIEKILVIGDIHGEYERLLEILQKAGVVDQKGKWIFNHGHVIFTGDVVDRGDKVTEALWLIYNLEKQAEMNGGKVHYLLGNHEVMLFEKDTRYLNLKYYFFARRYNQSYYSLFKGNSVLGSWLKNKNSILKINDILFVHAGMSPLLAQSNLTLEQINLIVRNYIERPEHYKNDSLTLQVLGASGILWYRGYLAKLRDFYPRISPEEIQPILDQYQVSRIVFGHTGLKNISPMFHNQLIDIDVPFKEMNIPTQLLLIENNTYYIIANDGSKTLLFE